MSRIPQTTANTNDVIETDNAIEFTCMTGVSRFCEGQTVPISQQGFRTFIADIVAVAFFLQTMGGLMISADLSVYYAKSLGAYMCVFKASQVNLWLVLQAVYYFMRAAGAESMLTDSMNTVNEYVCTCLLDI